MSDHLESSVSEALAAVRLLETKRARALAAVEVAEADYARVLAQLQEECGVGTLEDGRRLLAALESEVRVELEKVTAALAAAVPADPV